MGRKKKQVRTMDPGAESRAHRWAARVLLLSCLAASEGYLWLLRTFWRTFMSSMSSQDMPTPTKILIDNGALWHIALAVGVAAWLMTERLCTGSRWVPYARAAITFLLVVAIVMSSVAVLSAMCVRPVPMD